LASETGICARNCTRRLRKGKQQRSGRGIITATLDKLAQIERFIDAVSCSLTPEAAQAVLDFRADDVTQAELDDLADKVARKTPPAV
jgi:hypothetical protein